MKNENDQSALSKQQIDSVIALYSSGKIKETIDAIKALNEEFPNVPLLFNILGACYKSLGQLEESAQMFKSAVTIKPDYAEAHKNLGITLKDLEQLNDAVKSFKKAISIEPDYIDAHFNLAITLNELNQLDDAVKSYEKVIVINPNFAEAHNNLGNVLKALGQMDDAVKSYGRAIANKSNFTEAHYNLGILSKELGQMDAAVKSLEKVIDLKPDYTEAHNNLGLTFMVLGQFVEAFDCYKRALAINPNYAYAHKNLGTVLGVLGEKKAAAKSYEKAIAINPDYAEAYNNLGNIYRSYKQRDKALICFERAIDLKPDINYIFGALLNTKMHLCIWDDLISNLKELRIKINNGEKAMGPFALMGLIDDPALQRKAAEIFVNDQFPKNYVLSKIDPYPRHSKIRIGYFSADYKVHPTSFLSAELYETHDRSQFEIHAFSFGKDTKDEMNLRIKAGVDHFHNVLSMSNKDVAMLARSLEIDIAVDLGGFTGNSRTKIFAMSAAPIQVSYLGYPGTMCAEYMDYIIADKTLIPKDKQHHYSEKIVYMPNSYQVNVSKHNISDTSLLRNELGLPNNGFVFCCFNNAYKITPSTFSGWMRILKAVEGSVLWLLVNNNNSIENLKKEAVILGVDGDRLVFAPYMPLEEHLNRIKYADLFIDTLPYNAHTTSSDALRIGLPVLTCIGNSFASRVAASILNAVNLPELITTTQEEYESLAIELAINPEKFKIIKNKLVSNLSITPLYNTPMFTKHLESAYRKMYERYHQGSDIDHIYLEH